MSIGTLGSAGDQFRDFLGGSQRDIGQGLQAVLSNYTNPSGNFGRLNDRTQGMFQLTSNEYQSTFDRDAQNSYSQAWYSEYRAVLLLRAEALKKKLNRSYTGLLENSIYAPVLPDSKWAPQANRDRNDIDASDPLQFFKGGTVDNPAPPTDANIDPTAYLHPDWFSGTNKYSAGSGNAYDDIRRYVNHKYLKSVSGQDLYAFGDIDGDGERILYDNGAGYKDTTAYDGFYDAGGEGPGSGGSSYYNLWDVRPILNPNGTIYGLDAAGVAGARYQDIAKEMNVPPSTTTQNFVVSGGSDTYYIEIPANGTSGMSATQLGYLPTFVTSQDPDKNGIFTVAQRDAIIAQGLTLANFKDLGGGNWEIVGGVKFYDPAGARNQTMFSPSSVGEQAGPITNITLNSQLIPPDGSNNTERDLIGTAASRPIYQQDFVDSWREARQIQKREAQVDAAYKAYLDGKAKLASDPDWTYEKIMDQVFVALDQIGGSGGPLPPGGGPPPSVPPSGLNGANLMDNIMPYGYYYMPGPSTPFAQKSPGNRDINPIYGVGSDYDTPNEMDAGSIYKMIYDRLALAADPTSITGGNSGTTALSGSLPGNPGTPYPGPAPGTYATGANDSKLYTPVPIGAAEINNATDGQPNINHAPGVSGLNDTLNEAQNWTMDNISKLFVGRQWDYSPGYTGSGYATAGSADVAPVKYDAETISSHLMVLPGWFYDSMPGSLVGQAVVTLTPPIDGLAWQTAANSYGLGKLDDIANFTLGGPFFHVAGGSDSLGFGPDWDGAPVKYSIAVGFGAGIGGIYWGHTSAVGTVGRIEDLMTDPGPVFSIMKGSLGVLAGLGGASPSDMSLFPNVGIAGFHFDANIPIPIPIPPGAITFLNVPMTTYGAASYDILTDYLYRYLDAMKHEVVDSLSAYSYATSGGYAMDSYGMRGEYQFTEKPAFEMIKKMPDLFGIVPVSDILRSAVGMLGLENYSINNWSLNDDGIFEGRKHSFNAAEARELDTGAFFSTAAFMSQFQLDGLKYSYWTNTVQNEEMANMDALRLVQMTGKELMKILNKAIFTIAGRLEADGPMTAITLAVMNFMLQGFQESVNEAVMWDVLLHDQNEKGFVTSMKITNSSLDSEGYDFIEDERKLFDYDYEQTTKAGVMQKALAGGMGSFELPNQVLYGTANTRRYKPYIAGVDARAGRQGYGAAFTGKRDGNGNIIAGEDVRAHYLIRHRNDNTRYDDTWDLSQGFWRDSGMGDINEVYVRKNVVTYTGSITDGLDPATPNVETVIDRYVGSHNRIIGRSYDGAAPLNLETFRTGYFANRYFGEFIGDPSGGGDNAFTVGVVGQVDGRNVNVTLHGGQKYYKRINDYDMTVTTGSNTVTLEGQQALAPVFGGNMKLMSVDMNDANQRFGASTTGVENPLTSELYKYMRINEDGSNAQLVKEYRDVFNMGLLDDIYINGNAYAPTGGGVTSSIRLKFRRTGSTAAGSNLINLDPYEQRRNQEIVGSTTVVNTAGATVTQNLMTEPGFLGRRSEFKNISNGAVDIFLSSFFAFKRAPKEEAK